MLGKQERSFIEAARRAQIVAAAIAAIAAEGYARASFTRIASEAGISPGLITYHFKTKDELMKAVLLRVDQNLDRAMSGDERSVNSYSDALQQIITGFVHHCVENPVEMRALHEIIAGALSPTLTDAVTTRGDTGRTELIDFVTEAQQEGEFRDFNPEVFAEILLDTLQAVPRYLRQHPQRDPEIYAQELSALFTQAALA